MTKTTYTLVRLTGATLTSGRGESAGVISRHRSESAAQRAADAYRRICPCGSRVEVRGA